MMTPQERVFKVNEIICWLSYQKLPWQRLMKIKGLSQESFLSEFQYQNSTKWWRHQWLGLNLLKPRSFLAIITKIIKSKSIHVQIQVSKWEKRKNGKKTMGYKTSQYVDYKSRQNGLQIGVALRISNRGKSITYRDKEI